MAKTRQHYFHRFIKKARRGLYSIYATIRRYYSVGRWGERIASRFLRSHGVVTLCTNWGTPRGEVDILAQHGRTLLCVEVKTRREGLSSVFSGEARIDEEKLSRVRKMAMRFIRRNRRLIVHNRIIQFQLIAVVVTYKNISKRLGIRKYNIASYKIESERIRPSALPDEW